SNSTLVAPLDVGQGAYVAAGSVITDAAPEDALALGRARQVLKECWGRRGGAGWWGVFAVYWGRHCAYFP
ncbi:MAG: hypothetical protein P4K98_11170, partial [Bryobacteraceae bacterium]|nr:hypothetical protein [Bryobacteraceae bacterium]